MRHERRHAAGSTMFPGCHSPPCNLMILRILLSRTGEKKKLHIRMRQFLQYACNTFIRPGWDACRPFMVWARYDGAAGTGGRFTEICGIVSVFRCLQYCSSIANLVKLLQRAQNTRMPVLWKSIVHQLYTQRVHTKKEMSFLFSL